MALTQELGFLRAINDPSHEAILGLVVTAELFWKEADRLLRPFRLTDSQLKVLMLLLYQSESGELDRTTLGRMLAVNRSNVTGLLDRLERIGLVVRARDPSDRRVRKVRLTAQGRKRAEEAAGRYLAKVHAVMSGLTRRERDLLCRALERIRAGLRARS